MASEPAPADAQPLQASIYVGWVVRTAMRRHAVGVRLAPTRRRASASASDVEQLHVVVGRGRPCGPPHFGPGVASLIQLPAAHAERPRAYLVARPPLAPS